MLIKVIWCGNLRGAIFQRDFIPPLCSPPGSSDGVWVKHCFSDRYHYYYNLETGQGSWEEPEGCPHRGDHLCKEEIQVLLLSLFFFLSFLSLLVTSICWFFYFNLVNLLICNICVKTLLFPL